MENWLLKRDQLSGSQIALYYLDQAITFHELTNDVTRWAEKLTGLNLPNNRPIALLGTNRKNTYELILALQQLQHPVVLLNFRLSRKELQTQLDDADPALLIVDDHLFQWSDLKIKSGLVLSYPKLIQQRSEPFTPKPEFQNAALADIMYTSGSTGKPKGVLHTFGNHFYSAIGTGLNFNLTDKDAWICTVPLFHISGLSIMMRSLIYGLAVYLEPDFSAPRLNQILANESATIISVVPYMLKKLLGALPENGHYQPEFKGFFLGGGPIDSQTLEICKAHHMPVVQSYGMTETTSNIAALKFRDAGQKIGSAGQALFPVQLRIEPENNQGIGEIQVKSPTLAKGYLHQPDAFKAQFTPDHWFKTGDVGLLDNEGYLYLKGRKDTMFISGGENIFPNEIEAVYTQYPGIQEIAVTHRKDPRWGSVPIAYLVAEPGISLDAAALKTFGRERLAHYKVPDTFYLLDNLPKTANGKLDYGAIFALEIPLDQALQ